MSDRYPTPVREKPDVPPLVSDRQPRCQGTSRGRACHRMLAELVTRPWVIKCSRCGYVNVAQGPIQKS